MPIGVCTSSTGEKYSSSEPVSDRPGAEVTLEQLNLRLRSSSRAIGEKCGGQCEDGDVDVEDCRGLERGGSCVMRFIARMVGMTLYMLLAPEMDVD